MDTCTTCHGSGGREIPATWSHPREWDECSSCHGETSPCTDVLCRCQMPCWCEDDRRCEFCRRSR
jgi:hypothetical protein